jgi:heme exporter protein CcmD
MSGLFAMGGYGVYVWGSIGFTLAVYAWNLAAPALQRRALMQRLSDPDFPEDDDA